MKTLFLMPNNWDLVLDASGNIAVASSTYQQAQDIASECRVFTGDMYFSQAEGIPYIEDILGKGRYPLALYRKHLHDRAMLVPGVVSANAEFSLSDSRNLTGAIKFTNEQGQTGVINL